ncbi:zinc-activated ligand-gated ion channel-like [Tachysurus vachellii]|uniref:zinc-activated ligand-gated ion channel-like n=1 Tax=Tachysurus vachellii TaxID=175792 RepID=UPI00296B4CCD|nr:zinc-activated ligand-gated ion channel-like [Tachysurus vachellii]
MVSTEMIGKFLLVLYFVIASAYTVSATQCFSRRCLANDFIGKEIYSAPQTPDCLINVNLTTIQYETLSFNLQTLEFSSHLKVFMEWNDPELAWTDSQYNFTELLLPYNYVWLPNLTVNNAIYTKVQPLSNDILVTRDGAVNYAINMYITVVCDMNLFAFPFVKDTCIVAIKGWNQSSCGVNFHFGTINTVGGQDGEWQTSDVQLCGGNLTYIQITLHLNPFNAMVSLVLPTALIMIVDLVSFTLPLDGERNAFKIKLVFSFAMFLLILSKQLPEGSSCSPLIYYHFCFCLLVLVVSLLVSMILSRLARTGSVWASRSQKQNGSGSSKTQQDNGVHQDATEMNSSKANAVDLMTEVTSIQKISSFVNNMDMELIEKMRRQVYAKYWDNFFFNVYLSLDIIYMLCAIAFFITKDCSSDKLDM